MQTNERYQTISETADQLSVSTRTVRRYIADGKLRAYLVADTGRLRVKASDLNALLVLVGPHDGAARA